MLRPLVLTILPHATPGEEPKNGGKCPSVNLCMKCFLCNVCGHCLPSCPDYRALTPVPAQQPSRTSSEERREKAKNRMRKGRANETKEHRDAPLLKARERSTARRAKIAASAEEQLAHNKREAERKKAQRAKRDSISDCMTAKEESSRRLEVKCSNQRST